jgi:hypothetical protein
MSQMDDAMEFDDELEEAKAEAKAAYACTAHPGYEGANTRDLEYQPVERVDTYYSYEWSGRAHALHATLVADHLKPVVYLVLLVIAARLAHDSKPGTLTIVGTAYPSLKLLAKDSGLSTATVKRSLRQLQDKGFFRVEKIKPCLSG